MRFMEVAIETVFEVTLQVIDAITDSRIDVGIASGRCDGDEPENHDWSYSTSGHGVHKQVLT